MNLANQTRSTRATLDMEIPAPRPFLNLRPPRSSASSEMDNVPSLFTLLPPAIPTKLVVSSIAPAHKPDLIPLLVRAGILCLVGISLDTSPALPASNSNNTASEPWTKDVLKIYREESWAFEWGEHEDPSGPELPCLQVGREEDNASAVNLVVERIKNRRSVLLYPMEDNLKCRGEVWKVVAQVVGCLAGTAAGRVVDAWKSAEVSNGLGIPVQYFAAKF